MCPIPLLQTVADAAETITMGTFRVSFFIDQMERGSGEFDVQIYYLDRSVDLAFVLCLLIAAMVVFAVRASSQNRISILPASSHPNTTVVATISA